MTPALYILGAAALVASVAWAYGGPQLAAMARWVYSWCRP